MKTRRNLKKERQRFGFWRWYLPRLVKTLAIFGLYLGFVVSVAAFFWFAVFPAIEWLVEASPYLQVTILLTIIFTVTTFIAWGIHWAEVHKRDC